MMYCKKCGTFVNPGEQFCGSCGIPINDGQTKDNGNGAGDAQFGNYETQAKKKPNLLLAGISIVLVAVIAVIAMRPSYKTVVKKYFKAIENRDPKLMLSITAEYWKDYAREGWYLDLEELIDDFEDELDERVSDYGSGQNIRIKYKITDSYKASRDEVEELEDYIYDGFAYYVYDRKDFNISEAYVVDIEFEVKDDYDTTNWTINDLLIIKENGKWKLTRGYIDTSWL